MGIFQSSMTRYISLSGVEPDDKILYNTPPAWDNTKKVHRNGCSLVRKLRQYLTPICIFVVGLLVGVALGVLVSTYIKNQSSTDRSSLQIEIKQFAPEMPTRTIIFEKETALMDPPNDTNQRFWDALMPTGHGFVNVTHPEEYGLLPGITTDSGVDRYAVAMFHQIHCLAFIRHDYWRLVEGMSSDWTDADRKKELYRQLHGHHARHCFVYIMESIMCAGDLTIEWAAIEKDGSRKQVKGWGVPHQCKDPDAIREWMEANHGPAKDANFHIHN